MTRETICALRKRNVHAKFAFSQTYVTVVCVVKGIKIRITAKFRDSTRLRFED